MSVKNFKISTGLDLNGKVLEYTTISGTEGLFWDSNLLATQEYVTNAIAGVDTDLSDNAGAYLDWNVTTSAFDVDAAGLVSGASYLQYLTPAGPLDVNISALVTELTVNQGLALATDVPSTTDGLSEGINNLYYTDSRVNTVINNSLGAGGDIATAIAAAAYTDADAVDAIAASLGTG